MKPLRWVNIMAVIVLFGSLIFVFSTFFWKEMDTMGIIWRIFAMLLELGLLITNLWILISGEIKYRKDLKRLKEIQNLDNK